VRSVYRVHDIDRLSHGRFLSPDQWAFNGRRGGLCLARDLLFFRVSMVVVVDSQCISLLHPKICNVPISSRHFGEERLLSSSTAPVRLISISQASRSLLSKCLLLACDIGTMYASSI
jgi:hypothetical protein